MIPSSSKKPVGRPKKVVPEPAPVAAEVAPAEQAFAQPRQQRRSHPFITILVLAIIIGLSGAFVWLYRGQEITAKETQISQLKQQVSRTAQQQDAAQAARQAEAAKFQTVTSKEVRLRLPVAWKQQPTEFPADESVYGDANVSLRIVSSTTRNTTSQYIPTVDYLWQIGLDDDNKVVVKNQSLQCDRFDTLDNDLSSTVRQHNGFRVYCDKNGGRLTIAALGSPEAYGIGSRDIYFIITINDIQQVSLNDIKNYLQSVQIVGQAATQL